MDALVPPQQPPSSPAPQQSSSRTILIIISIAVLVAAIGYLGYQNWQLKQQVSRLEKIIQVDNTTSKLSSSTPSPDPTADWKTYTNIKYGYSIKYPPTFTTLETPGDIYLHQVEFKGTEQTYLSGIIVEVRSLTNLEEEVDYRKWQVVGHIVADKLDSEVPISIFSLPGKRLNYTSGQKQFSIIIVPYQKLVYTLEAESNLLDQILSTFKFTNTSSTGENSATTYVNKKFGFSFTRPAGFIVDDTISGSETFTTIYIKPSTSTPNDEVNLRIFTGDYYKTYEDAVQMAKDNIQNPQITSTTNGIMYAGKQMPGAMEGLDRRDAIFMTKPYPTVIELWGDKPTELTAFNEIVHSFTVTSN